MVGEHAGLGEDYTLAGTVGQVPLILNTITVTGTGTVTMPPDEVTVYLSVQTTSDDAATGQQINAKKMVLSSSSITFVFFD